MDESIPTVSAAGKGLISDALSTLREGIEDINVTRVESTAKSGGDVSEMIADGEDIEVRAVASPVERTVVVESSEVRAVALPASKASCPDILRLVRLD